MKTITNKGKKLIFIFTCPLCNQGWETDEWEVEIGDEGILIRVSSCGTCGGVIPAFAAKE